ncbi:MAG: hypothetical protein QXY90_04955 [Candidatus Anstonellales archaeon]
MRIRSKSLKNLAAVVLEIILDADCSLSEWSCGKDRDVGQSEPVQDCKRQD